jgi:hypothetical protein
MNTREWAARAEIVASIAVVVSLVFLVQEVRDNTRALERQTYLDQQSRLVSPYMDSAEFRSLYAKIKTVDGVEPQVAAFMDRYDLSMEQAVYWVRSPEILFVQLEADYLTLGLDARMADMVNGLLSFPDAALYWTSIRGGQGKHDQRFVRWVESIRKDGDEAPAGR